MIKRDTQGCQAALFIDFENEAALRAEFPAAAFVDYCRKILSSSAAVSWFLPTILRTPSI
jgi:hypothetical protein